MHDPEQVDDQQDAAADVPHGVPARRDAVDIAGPGNVRQQRLVEDVAREANPMLPAMKRTDPVR